MDDLIYRSAAIEAMTADNLNRNMDSVHDDDIKRAARAAQRALARLPAAQRWIPVTEPPEKNGMYLVCENCDHKDGVFQFVSMASYAANLNAVDDYDFPGEENKRPGWFRHDSEYGYYEVGTGRPGYITHWRELPEPPKEEAE